MTKPNMLTFTIYRDRKGEYRWRGKHRNGNKMANGGEGYSRRVDCVRSLKSFMCNIKGGRFSIVR